MAALPTNYDNNTPSADQHPAAHNGTNAAVNALDARVAAVEAGAGTVPDGSITSAKIADGTIDTGDVKDGAITSAKIADGTIATGDIADNAVTLAKMADMAANTVRGRLTSAGDPQDLTVAQAQALLTIDTLTARVAALETGLAARKANIGPPGRWVWAWNGSANSSVAQTAQRLVLGRFLAEQPFDMFGIDIGTAVASSTLIVGIYRCDANGMPTSVAAQGTVDASTTGSKTISFTALPAGLYWQATLPSGAINLRSSSSMATLFLTNSTGTAVNVNANWNSWFIGSLAALPDPFSGATSLGTTLPVSQIRMA